MTTCWHPGNKKVLNLMNTDPRDGPPFTDPGCASGRNMRIIEISVILRVDMRVAEGAPVQTWLAPHQNGDAYLATEM